MFLIKIVKFFNIENPKSLGGFGFFFYILTFFKKFGNQCLYFLIIVV